MDFTKYRNTKPYPTKVHKPKLKTDTPQGYRDLADELETYEQMMVAYRKATDEYHTESRELLTKFKSDLFVDLGLVDHPKALVLYNYAWEKGHSSGFEEVYSIAEQMLDLVIYTDYDASLLLQWVTKRKNS